MITRNSKTINGGTVKTRKVRKNGPRRSKRKNRRNSLLFSER